jgi:hypothetical protein
MDRQEVIADIKEQMRQGFSDLSEEEKDVLRQNTGTRYNMILKKVIPTEIVGGITFKQPANVQERKRGLATR